jgi:cytochrome P450
MPSRDWGKHMSIEATAPALQIPMEIAEAAVLPQSYKEERAVTYPALKWLRENNPLGLAQLDGYDPFYLVTTYDDVMTVERQLFDAFGIGDQSPILNSAADDAFIRTMTGGSTRSIDVVTFMDPPEHTLIRRLMSPMFRPNFLRTVEPRIKALAKREVDRLFAHEGQCDFAKDFALWFPLRVITELFGLPSEDEDRIMELTQGIFAPTDPEEQRAEIQMSPDAAAQMWIEAVTGFNEYFHAKTLQRRAEPTDDLLSFIANCRIDGEYIDEKYANGQYIGLASAGHDTTSSTLVGAMLALIERPEQLRLVQADMSLVDDLVEESIRYVSPVKHMMRCALRDVELHGRAIRTGDRLMLCFASANRDEKQFGPSADEFDISQPRPKHAGFGFGPHQCQGMAVARLALRVVFEELLPRLKSVELAGEPRYKQANFVTGIKSLPVRVSHT